ncbi:hypothetical protein BJF93_23270 [Xaviernesmea oryzae]|uniref:Capsule synthesis protein CapA domain-containing protein n=1 Tax=Xaviernesmea oryzae TaxID=464029 RepID=A0A1Q9AU54_9HYPH|nr:CapA family protein [Xaviernesmea oryzae]OLP58943.1 hypothetical protein BJF93_23270 [Xaviernesmea oryzae]SEM00950.1 poly-gamma-glutamate synthesis protein (capsule biosynthesis protein) [Xaviernesmea oryzae]
MATHYLLSGVGDIVIRHRLFDKNTPLHAAYQRTLEYLRTAAMVWGSCEVQFSHRGYRTDAPIAYLVDPAIAEDLGRAGFDVMTVATNHTKDFGADAFLDTLDHLRGAGIATVGGGPTIREAVAPLVRDVGGRRLGILAASCLLPPDYAATDHRPGIAPIRIKQWPEIDPILLATEPGAPLPMRSSVDPDDLERLCASVRDLRTEVDILIVSVHWGFGRGNPLAEYQRPLGRALIDAGADLVLGNHPHSPAGIETYRGRPILYSLGNHIAQQDWENATPVQQQIFSQIDPWSLVCRVVAGDAGIEEIEFRVTECDAAGLPNLVDEVAVADPVLRRFRALSKAMGTEVAISAATAVARFNARPTAG